MGSGCCRGACISERLLLAQSGRSCARLLQLAVDRQIEHGWVASAASIWSVFQIDQTCLGRNGGFAPVSLPLFQATVYEALG
jgi:hypothetical protein